MSSAIALVLAVFVLLAAGAFVAALISWHRANLDRLRSDFAALAAEKLEEKANDLSEKNAKDVKPLFDALRQNIDDLRKVAESAKDVNIKLGGELAVKIDEVGKKAQNLGKQRQGLTLSSRLAHVRRACRTLRCSMACTGRCS